MLPSVSATQHLGTAAGHDSSAVARQRGRKPCRQELLQLMVETDHCAFACVDTALTVITGTRNTTLPFVSSVVPKIAGARTDTDVVPEFQTAAPAFSGRRASSQP
jgi:hypothetical protein